MADALTLTRGAKPGATHYDVLGLPHSATKEDVIQAFGRHMSALTPRSMAELAKLSVAYETLRDPEKRRAYDAALNSLPKPYSVQWTPAPPAALALVDRLSRPVEPPPLVRSSVTPAILTEKQDPPKPEVSSPVASSKSPMLKSRPMDNYRPNRRSRSRYEESETDWKKVAAAVAWPVLGVAMVGGIAGWSASINRQPSPDALTIPLPAPELALEPETIVPTPSVSESLPIKPPRQIPEQPMPARTTVAKAEPRAEASTEIAKAPIAKTEEVSSMPTAEATPMPEPPAVAMPLPNAVIARTIGRIGYPCGRVVSTSPVEGAAPGVFKITCTSGNAYQASPVGGRYHFRKWGRR